MIIPDPVIDREKNACPIAIIQVRISSRALHLGTNK